MRHAPGAEPPDPPGARPGPSAGCPPQSRAGGSGPPSRGPWQAAGGRGALAERLVSDNRPHFRDGVAHTWSMAAVAGPVRSLRPMPARRAPHAEDDHLVARVRAGDQEAFEAIYDRYSRGLLAF